MSDLDSALKNLESDIVRDNEIKRVLESLPKDYFAILQINPLESREGLPQQLRQIYRRKSLLIHPDKTKNPNAPRAFSLLKKAEHILSLEETASFKEDQISADAAEKKALIDLYKEVNMRLQLPIQLDFNHADNKKIREKVSHILESHQKNQEVERSFAQRQELKRREEIKAAAKEKELKKSWESRWEQDRVDRVKLWRTFTSKVDKSKKKKRKVLA